MIKKYFLISPQKKTCRCQYANLRANNFIDFFNIFHIFSEIEIKKHIIWINKYESLVEIDNIDNIENSEIYNRLENGNIVDNNHKFCIFIKNNNNPIISNIKSILFNKKSTINHYSDYEINKIIKRDYILSINSKEIRFLIQNLNYSKSKKEYTDYSLIKNYNDDGKSFIIIKNNVTDIIGGFFY